MTIRRILTGWQPDRLRDDARGGTADLWTLDVRTRKAKSLTSGPGGDFRPAWSPDGMWIAFSSDRESSLPMAKGRWEHLHLDRKRRVLFRSSRSHPDPAAISVRHGRPMECGSPSLPTARVRFQWRKAVGSTSISSISIWCARTAAG